MSVITEEDLARLRAHLTDGDRGGFYMDYYRLTGSEQALEQAQITTYSGGWGGAAIAGNAVAKANNSDVNYNVKSKKGDTILIIEKRGHNTKKGDTILIKGDTIIKRGHDVKYYHCQLI